jgi:RNA polymerase sigma factor (sigma-70 family)
MTTKTCSSCHIEKDLSQFHRRGSRHQNICKVCRLEAAKHPHTPRVKKDNSKNYQAIGERIQSLEPRLRKIARSHSNDQHQADDIFSYICEKLLEQQDPTDSDSRILTTAKRRAGDYIQRENTYSFMVGSETEIGGDKENELEAFETYIPDQPKSIEEAIIEKEFHQGILKAVGELDERNQKIVAMLAEGSTQADIARELGISQAAITYRMEAIRQTLQFSL